MKAAIFDMDGTLVDSMYYWRTVSLAFLRAKGIVPEQDGTWLHFDMVPGEIELRHGAADYTGRLCVIGSGIKEDALAALFA